MERNELPKVIHLLFNPVLLLILLFWVAKNVCTQNQGEKIFEGRQIYQRHLKDSQRVLRILRHEKRQANRERGKHRTRTKMRSPTHPEYPNTRIHFNYLHPYPHPIIIIFLKSLVAIRQRIILVASHPNWEPKPILVRILDPRPNPSLGTPIPPLMKLNTIFCSNVMLPY